MKLQKNKTLATIALVLLLTVSISLAVAPNSTVDAQADLLQYEWPSGVGDLNVGFKTPSGGPAPTSQDVLWRSDLGQPYSAFNGMVFLTGGWAVDAFTGTPIYQHLGTHPTKISETRFISIANPSAFSPIPGGKLYVYETNTGNLLYNYTTTKGIPTSINDNIAYNNELGMFWTTQGEPFYGMDHILYGWDWPDVSQEPTLKWEKRIQKGIGTDEYFGGYIFIGTAEMTCMALDGETGDFLWEIPLEGYLGYSASYYDGKYIHATFDQIYCIEAATGTVLWTFNPGTFWNFWADMGAIYDGKMCVINTDYNTYCLDVETGDVLWRWESTEGSGYQRYTVGGGGVFYALTGRGGGVYDDPETGIPFEDEYVCLDADTGKLLWKTGIISGTGGGGPPAVNDILAYGNLYVNTIEAQCVAYGPPQPWSSFKGNVANTGVGDRNGPEDLDVKWIAQLDSAIITAPVAANNKIYVGTVMGTFYAIDHMTGDPVWTFKTDKDVKFSSAGYDSGRVYVASDDGYQYCLDAENGNEVWKTYIGSDTEYLYHGRFRKTSSPTVVNGRVYVGSTNFNLYCLNAANGAIIWTKPLGGLISSAPAVSDGAVYIPVGGTSELTSDETGGPNGTLYKLNAVDGSTIWESGIPYVHTGGIGFGQFQPREFFGSPCVAEGMVFQAANAWRTYGINATTGQIVWNYTIYSGGMLNDITPVFANGKVYVQDFFRLACLDAFNGSKIWDQWLAHSVHGDPIYADGKIYAASDFKVMWSLDSETGEKLDFYKWNDPCFSAPCIYDNKLYWGTAGMKLFCFEERPYGTVYYGSSATTASATEQAESTPAITAQLPETAPSPTIESTTLTPINMYLIAAALAVVAVIVAAAIFLRKRK